MKPFLLSNFLNLHFLDIYILKRWTISIFNQTEFNCYFSIFLKYFENNPTWFYDVNNTIMNFCSIMQVLNSHKCFILLVYMEYILQLIHLNIATAAAFCMHDLWTNLQPLCSIKMHFKHEQTKRPLFGPTIIKIIETLWIFKFQVRQMFYRYFYNN